MIFRVDLSARFVSRTGDAVSWPRPAGSLTARVFYNGGSVPLRVGTRLSLWKCVLSFSHSSVSPSLSGLPQLEPRALTVISPFHHPTVFPNPDRSHIYSVDSFIRWFIARQCSHPVCTLTRNHTPCLVSHTPQWLVICFLQPERLSFLTVEGCRQAFTLLSVHLHQFNTIQSNCPI